MLYLIMSSASFLYSVFMPSFNIYSCKSFFPYITFPINQIDYYAFKRRTFLFFLSLPPSSIIYVLYDMKRPIEEVESSKQAGKRTKSKDIVNRVILYYFPFNLITIFFLYM
ncbi:MAG: hypothetical protein EXX96DRAFT_586655 [Benjaminiella poitrasii]|nr:MAG: hypothetical protein EXX96DRAFT_586655 [Benjaminiella poitrasii]